MLLKPKTRRLVFESLEPRVLLAADGLGLAAGLTSAAYNQTVGQTAVDAQASSSLAAIGAVGTALQGTASAQASSLAARQHSALELVIIDASIAAADRATLLADAQAQRSAGRQLQVIELDAQRDPIAQISLALASQEQPVAALHLISHCEAGALQLGSTRLDMMRIGAYRDALQGWSNYLTDDADLMLYGCDLAANSRGRALMQTLADWTGADVAASANATGAAADAADWALEAQVGAVDAADVLSAQAQQAWQTPLAAQSETLVNTGQTDGVQTTVAGASRSQRSIATASNGVSVAVWVSDGNVWAQRFDATGAPMNGGPFEVTTATAGAASQASVAMDRNSGGEVFVVVWASEDAGQGTNIRAQMYKSGTGANTITTDGSAFVVNSVTTGNQISPSVDIAEDGKFVVVWESDASTREGIYARWYDRNGAAQTNTDFSIAAGADKENPMVATRNGGDFVVVYDAGVGGLSSTLRLAYVDVSKDQIKYTNDVATGLPGENKAAVTITGTDDIVVVWHDTTSTAIRQAMYNLDGSAITTAVATVHSAFPGVARAASVSATRTSGEYVVTWEGIGSNDDYGIFAQRFAANGTKSGSVLQINSTIAGRQEHASVAVLALNDFRVAWSGAGLGDTDGVFMRTVRQGVLTLDDTGYNVAGASLTVNAANGVLTNDQLLATGTAARVVNPDGSVLTAARTITTTLGNRVVLSADGSFVYSRVNQDAFGTDTFTYDAKTATTADPISQSVVTLQVAARPRITYSASTDIAIDEDTQVRLASNLQVTQAEDSRIVTVELRALYPDNGNTQLGSLTLDAAFGVPPQPNNPDLVILRGTVQDVNLAIANITLQAPDNYSGTAQLVAKVTDDNDLADTLTVDFAVNSVDDPLTFVAPLGSAQSPAVPVTENRPFSMILQVNEPDQQGNVPLNWRLAPNAVGNDNNLFTLNAFTGELSFVGLPDFESRANAQMLVEVQVDERQGGSTVTRSATLRLELVDASDTLTVTSSNDAALNSAEQRRTMADLTSGMLTNLTLRQAIALANNTPGVQQIRFNNVSKIDLIDTLTITDTIDIAGTTDTTRRNTLAGLIQRSAGEEVGSNARIAVELSGPNTGTSMHGLVLQGANANGSIVRDLSVTDFTGYGVVVSASSNNQILGNWIGLTPTGSLASNGDGGVAIQGVSQANRIGSASPADRNVIAGNDGSGLDLIGPGVTQTAVFGNMIGDNPTSAIDLANTGAGVRIRGGASNNVIGGLQTAENNLIAAGSGTGVVVENGGGNASIGNAIRGNLTRGVPSVMRPIDVLVNGATGPNALAAPVDRNLENMQVVAPTLTSVTLQSGALRVIGAVAGTPASAYLNAPVDLYQLDADGNVIRVLTMAGSVGAGGVINLNFVLGDEALVRALAANPRLAATVNLPDSDARNAPLSTSELSAPVTIQTPPQLLMPWASGLTVNVDAWAQLILPASFGAPQPARTIRVADDGTGNLQVSLSVNQGSLSTAPDGSGAQSWATMTGSVTQINSWLAGIYYRNAQGQTDPAVLTVVVNDFESAAVELRSDLLINQGPRFAQTSVDLSINETIDDVTALDIVVAPNTPLTFQFIADDGTESDSHPDFAVVTGADGRYWLQFKNTTDADGPNPRLDYSVRLQARDPFGATTRQTVNVRIIDVDQTEFVVTSLADTSVYQGMASDQGGGMEWFYARLQANQPVTLRDALEATNRTLDSESPTPVQIRFNLSPTDAANPVIQLTQPLPVVQRTVELDGRTFSATPTEPRVVLQAPVTGSAQGLVLGTASGGSRIQGLALQGFGGDALVVHSGNNVIRDNLIRNNSGSGIVLASLQGNLGNELLVGSNEIVSNTVQNNGGHGLLFRGSGVRETVIQDNVIGGAAAGLGNTGLGVLFQSATSSHTLQRNLIGHNLGGGIAIDDTSQRIQVLADNQILTLGGSSPAIDLRSAAANAALPTPRLTRAMLTDTGWSFEGTVRPAGSLDGYVPFAGGQAQVVIVISRGDAGDAGQMLSDVLTVDLDHATGNFSITNPVLGEPVPADAVFSAYLLWDGHTSELSATVARLQAPRLELDLGSLPTQLVEAQPQALDFVRIVDPDADANWVRLTVDMGVLDVSDLMDTSGAAGRFELPNGIELDLSADRRSLTLTRLAGRSATQADLEQALQAVIYQPPAEISPTGTTRVRIEVTLRDEAGLSVPIEPMLITITPVNDLPTLSVTTVNNQALAPGDRVVVTENTVAVARVAATDPDLLAGGEISYTLVGADAAAFELTLDPNTGARSLVFRPPIDSEAAGAKTSYQVTIRASDDLGNTDFFLIVQVNEVDEAPLAFINTALNQPNNVLTINVPEGLRSTAEVLASVAARDPDLPMRDRVVSYTLLDAAGQAVPASFALTIDSTGQLIVRQGAELDYDAMASFDGFVQATIQGGPTISAALRVQLTSVDDNPLSNPVNLITTGALSLSETAGANTPVGLQLRATDDDKTWINGQSQSMTIAYQITSALYGDQDVRAFFSIGADGVVSYRGGLAALDFDQGPQTIRLSVTATSTDPSNVLAATTSQAVDFDIAVTNADDNPTLVTGTPRFDGPILESFRDTDRTVFTVSVSDVDRPNLLATDFTYQLNVANPLLPAWLTVSDGGVVTIDSWNSLDAEALRAMNGEYGFSVTVLDRAGTQIGLVSHVLQLTDVDEDDVKILVPTNLRPLPAVPENAQPGALTGDRFRVFDPDVSGQPARVWIANDTGAFAIEPLEGVPGDYLLVVKDPALLDHDLRAADWDGTIAVTVMASNRLNADGSVDDALADPAQHTFRIRIADVDDHGVGRFENQAQRNGARDLVATVDENNPGLISGFQLGASRADDVDRITGFAVGGDAAGLFDITDQGRLQVRGTGLNYEALAASNYQITVPVIVSFSDQTTATVNVTVQVRDVNEAPSVQLEAVNTAALANATWTIPMLSADPAAAVRLQLADPDNDALTVRVLDLPPGLAYDDATRSVRIVDRALLEPGSTEVTIRVSDGGLISTQTLTIQVALPSAWTPTLTMPEDTTRSIALADMFPAGTGLTALDTLRLSGASGARAQQLTVTQDGVAVADVRVLNDNTLQIRPVANFNGRLSIPVLAATSAASRTWLSGTVTVDVAAVNDAPLASAQAFSVFAGQGSGSSIAQMTASDVDANTTLQYTFRTADGSAPFNGVQLDRATGRVLVTDPALLATARSLAFQVLVSDGDAVTTVPVSVTVGAALSLTVTTNEDQAVRLDQRLASYMNERQLSLTTDMAATMAGLGQMQTRADGQSWFEPVANASGSAAWNFIARNERGESVPGVMTVSVSAVNDAPQASAPLRRDVAGSSVLTLQQSDFPFTDIESQGLQGIRITTLPVGGTLLLESRPITAGTIVSIAQLRSGQLSYQASSFTSSNSFGYRITDTVSATDADWSGSQQMWFDVRAVDTSAVVMGGASGGAESAAMGGGSVGSVGSVGSLSTSVGAAMGMAAAGSTSVSTASSGSSAASTSTSGSSTSINPGSVVASGNAGNALLASASGGTAANTGSSTASGSSAAQKQSGGMRADGDGFVVNATPTNSVNAPIETPRFQIASLASELSVGKLLAASGSAQASALKPLSQDPIMGVSLHPGLSLLSSNLQNALTQAQGWTPATIAAQSVPKESVTRSNTVMSYRTQTAYQQLDQLRHNVTDKAATTRINSVVSSVAVSGSMSVGYVIWLLRGGVLASTMISSMPAWRTIDPLPVLARGADGDEDDESLESLVAGGDAPAGAGKGTGPAGLAMPWINRAASALGLGARAA